MNQGMKRAASKSNRSRAQVSGHLRRARRRAAAALKSSKPDYRLLQAALALVCALAALAYLYKRRAAHAR